MHVRISTTRRNGTVYRYVQLVQSFRRPDGMPAHRVVASLGALKPTEIDNLRIALEASRNDQRVVVAKGAARPRVRVVDSLAYLDVALALHAWRQWGLSELLSELLGTQDEAVPTADVVAALTIQRCVAPGSKLYAQRWFPRTALPELLGIAPAQFNNTRVHRALTKLEQVGEPLQERLAQRQADREGAFSTLFLDVTNTWFEGHGPALAQKCKTKEGMIRRAVGIVLLCNQHGFPLRWQVIAGKETEPRGMTGVLRGVAGLPWASEVPVVCDRAMGRTAYLRDLLALPVRFLTALTVQEFDAFAGARLPSAAVSDLDVTSDDAPERAAHAVVKADMQRVGDTLCVLDLGVVTRTQDDENATAPVSWTSGADNPAQQALRLALDIAADVEAGSFPNWSAATKARGLRVQRMTELRHLVGLVPSLRDTILSQGSPLSPTVLSGLARLAPEVQPETYERQCARASSTRRASTRHGLTPRARTEPVRVRVVVTFNADHFVEQRRAARQTLAAIGAFVEDLNLRLAKTRRRREAVLAEIDRELRRRDLVEVFDLGVEEHEGRVVRAVASLRPTAWLLRRRFDGFSVLVAHPDLPHTGAQLALLYRAKDAVEKDFQTIKSVVELRPVWHHTDDKVRAHVTLCMLALLIQRSLERRLAETTKSPLTAARLFEELAPVQLNRVRSSDENSTTLYALTEPKADQRAVLGALDAESLLDEMEIQGRIVPR